MLNPYAGVDPYRNLYSSGDPTQQASPIQPLSQPDEDSLLSKIGGATLGGIGWAGRHLEPLFGGRAIRGVLGGHPDELATLIPFSDEMGLTDYSRRVSGQQLLGLQNNNDWGSWLAGLGTEVATDPATYLSLGGSALTDAGQVASKIGLTKGTSIAERAGSTLADALEKAGASPDLLTAASAAAEKSGSSLADLAGTSAWQPGMTQAQQAASQTGERLGGLFGVGLPFTKPTIFGASQEGADLANAVGKGASYVGGKIPGLPWLNKTVLEPAGRVGAMLFDKNAGGTLSAASQAESRAMAPANLAAQAAVKQSHVDMFNPLLEAGLLSPALKQQTSDELTSLLENRSSPLPYTPQGQAMGEAAVKSKQALDADREALRAAGVDVGHVENYAPRQLTQLDRPTKSYGPSGGQDFPITSPNMRGRIDPFRDLPKNLINDMSVDPAISGPNAALNPLQAAAHIRENILGMGPAEEQEMFALNQAAAQGPLPAADEARRLELKGKWDQSQELAEIMSGQDPQRAANNMPLFANNQISDIGTARLNNARALQGALARHNIMASGAAIGPPTNDTAAALEALEKAGLGGGGGQASLMDALKQRGVLPAGATGLGGVRISQGALDDAMRYGSKGFQAPPALRPLLNAFDSATNLTKGWMSSFWPSTPVRDVTTGLWQHAASGTGGPVDAFAHMAEASTLRQGKTLEGAAAKYFPEAAGMTDEAASKMLRDEMFVHDAWGEGGQASDVVGVGTHEEPGGPLLPNAPDAAQPSLSSQANPLNAVPKSWADANPFGVRGVGGARQTGNSLVRYGQDLRESIYQTQMGGNYLSRRAQGFAPAEASRQALATMYDYSGLTPFESNVMRRVVPYYNWARRNIPAQLQQLAQHPGGLAGMEARIANDARGQGLMPEAEHDELGIPVGQEQGGIQRFLSSLDTPAENTFGYVQQGPKQWEDMAMGLLGETNPLIKGPLELATGKQFYSGRDLGDLFSSTGNGLLEQALMNSPASRVLSTGRTLADPRKDVLTKAVNLLTPAKLSDQNMDQARTTAARQYIQDALSQRPEISHFENIAPRAGQEQNLTPEEIALLRLNKTIEAQSAAANKQRIGVRR